MAKVTMAQALLLVKVKLGGKVIAVIDEREATATEGKQL
jgi:starvation-inducible outer membrane lipoprotein